MDTLELPLDARPTKRSAEQRKINIEDVRDTELRRRSHHTYWLLCPARHPLTVTTSTQALELSSSLAIETRPPCCPFRLEETRSVAGILPVHLASPCRSPLPLATISLLGKCEWTLSAQLSMTGVVVMSNFTAHQSRRVAGRLSGL